MNINIHALRLPFYSFFFKRFKKNLPPCYLALPKSQRYDENCDPKPPLHPETPRFIGEYDILKILLTFN